MIIILEHKSGKKLFKEVKDSSVMKNFICNNLDNIKNVRIITEQDIKKAAKMLSDDLKANKIPFSGDVKFGKDTLYVEADPKIIDLLKSKYKAKDLGKGIYQVDTTKIVVKPYKEKLMSLTNPTGEKGKDGEGLGLKSSFDKGKAVGAEVAGIISDKNKLRNFVGV